MSASYRPRDGTETIAQITGAADLLADLFLGWGDLHCLSCGKVQDWSTLIEEVSQTIRAAPEQQGVSLRASIAERDELLEDRLSEFVRDGLSRIFLDGDPVLLADIDGAVLAEDVEIEIDSWGGTTGPWEHVRDAVKTALRLGRGSCVLSLGQGAIQDFGSHGCDSCGEVLPVVGRALLSLSSQEARCTDCLGRGVSLQIDETALVRDTRLSLVEGAITPWHEKNPGFYRGILEEICGRSGISMGTPWEQLGRGARSFLMRGQEDSEYRGVVYDMKRRLERSSHRTDSAGQWIASYCKSRECGSCGGKGLGDYAASVRFGSTTVPEVYAIEIGQLLELLGLGGDSSSDKGLPWEAGALAEQIAGLEAIKHCHLGQQLCDMNAADKHWLTSHLRSQR
ncbi:MAG: hypothetical protein JKY56_01675 [Kofleriaceae bacterium]|nr:hypothetical protein [Kofleriaceae bacterium]